MSYIALYRQWRPLTFDDIKGQDHITVTLKNGVISGRITHAYLFTGAHGTGKTTTAKVLARAVNCLSPNNGNPCNECCVCRGILSGSLLDVIEIDAASNNGVDNIREIRDEVNYCPSQARYKVYIIDEIHMLSGGAFNALLKTLEEPPAHVIFILATTEPHKLPATILSRCQRYDFRRVSIEDIVKRIKFIAAETGVNLNDDAALLIGRLSEGSVRDAISLLDQVFTLGRKDVTYEDVIYIAGIAHDESISDIADSIYNCDIDKVIELVNDVSSAGKSMSQFISDIIVYFRNLLVLGMTQGNTNLIYSNRKVLETMKKHAELYDKQMLIRIIRELSSAASEIKRSDHQRVFVEIELLKLCMLLQSNNEEIVCDNMNANRKHSNDKKDTSRRIPKESQEESPKRPEQICTANINEPQQKKVIAKEDKTDSEHADKHLCDSKSFEKWEEVMKVLREKGKIPLLHNLADAEIRLLSNEAIGIMFKPDNSANKDIISQPANIKCIEDVIYSVTGKAMKIKCMVQNDVKEKQDNFMEKVEQFAQTLGVPVNIIDE